MPDIDIKVSIKMHGDHITTSSKISNIDMWNYDINEDALAFKLNE